MIDISVPTIKPLTTAPIIPLGVNIKPLKSKTGGKIINSAGQTDLAAWGQPAEWVDYFGPVGSETLGAAILCHPSTFHHPNRWHVRDYGLFTANAFGLQSLDPKSETGTFTLKNGEAVQLRHRIIFHEGDEKAAGIAEAYRAYAASKPN